MMSCAQRYPNYHHQQNSGNSVDNAIVIEDGAYSNTGDSLMETNNYDGWSHYSLLSLAEDFLQSEADKYGNYLIKNVNTIATKIVSSRACIDPNSGCYLETLLVNCGIERPRILLYCSTFFEALLDALYTIPEIKNRIELQSNIEMFMYDMVLVFNENDRVMKYVACFKHGMLIPRMAEKLQTDIEFLGKAIAYINEKNMQTFIHPSNIHNYLYRHQAVVEYVAKNMSKYSGDTIAHLKSLCIPTLTSRILFYYFMNSFKGLPWRLRGTDFTRDELLRVLKDNPCMYQPLLENKGCIPYPAKKMIKESDFISEVIKENPYILLCLGNNVEYKMSLDSWIQFYTIIPKDQRHKIPRNVASVLLDTNYELKREYVSRLKK